MFSGLLILVNALCSVAQVVSAIGLLYYYALLAAAWLGRRDEPEGKDPDTRFAIAIPAHNEAAVIGATVAQLTQQDYPREWVDIHVVADHCTDRTAQVAHGAGATCYERTTGPSGRKSFALRWLLDQILACDKPYDALVVFDADSRVDPGFLRAMDAALGRPHQVLQGRHVIDVPDERRFSGMAAVDMRLNNLWRNQAKHNLGLSCRLMGDAMCFSTSVLAEQGWGADSLTEDREYGLFLLAHGLRVGYVRDAVSYGQAAPGWRDASKQRTRWYGGVSQIRRRFVLPLLGLALKGNLATLDQAIELLLPPFSVLALLSVGLVALQWLGRLDLLLPLTLTMFLAAAWVLLPFLGLWVDRAPASVFRALLAGPFYLAWRLWVGLWARLQGRRVRWVRTRRREEADVSSKALEHR